MTWHRMAHKPNGSREQTLELGLARILLPRDDAGVAQRYVERCYDCAPGHRCARHVACLQHLDARLAAEIGRGWAHFVWREMDVRRPWPDYGGRCAAIAERLVRGLALTDERQRELGRICSWRAEIAWAALTGKSRDMPYRTPDGGGLSYALPSAPHVEIRFRPRQRYGGAEVRPSTAALEQGRLRAERYREAQGVEAAARPFGRGSTDQRKR